MDNVLHPTKHTRRITPSRICKSKATIWSVLYYQPTNNAKCIYKPKKKVASFFNDNIDKFSPSILLRVCYQQVLSTNERRYSQQKSIPLNSQKKGLSQKLNYLITNQFSFDYSHYPTNLSHSSEIFCNSFHK